MVFPKTRVLYIQNSYLFVDYARIMFMSQYDDAADTEPISLPDCEQLFSYVKQANLD